MPGFESLLIASAAVRVASLNLCSDEYLLLLARPNEIASVSRLSHDPNDSPLWRLGRRHMANRGDLESALSARPNLLLTMGGTSRSTDAIARRLGIATIRLPYPATIADVRTGLKAVARALGDERRARPWEERLDRLERTAPRRALDAAYLGPRGQSVGAGSLSGQWMRLAGLAQRPVPGGRITLEQLAINPPAVLLRSSYRPGQRSRGQEWLSHPMAQPAKSRRIEIDGRAWTCAGPLMIREIEQLRARV